MITADNLQELKQKSEAQKQRNDPFVETFFLPSLIKLLKLHKKDAGFVKSTQSLRQFALNFAFNYGDGVLPRAIIKLLSRLDVDFMRFSSDAAASHAHLTQQMTDLNKLLQQKFDANLQEKLRDVQEKLNHIMDAKANTKLVKDAYDEANKLAKVASSMQYTQNSQQPTPPQENLGCGIPTLALVPLSYPILYSYMPLVWMAPSFSPTLAPAQSIPNSAVEPQHNPAFKLHIPIPKKPTTPFYFEMQKKQSSKLIKVKTGPEIPSNTPNSPEVRSISIASLGADHSHSSFRKKRKFEEI